MKYKITAVIPTQQYGNIQPSIEVESLTFEDAQAQVMPYIEGLWAQYGEKPLTSKTTNTSKRLKDFFGNEVDYDEGNHVYSWNGEVYESGSQYAKKFEKPFDGKEIARRMAKKYSVGARDIEDMWELKARTSREFGTALHSALELYGKYNGLAKALERDTAMHDHPVIKKAVESFYESRTGEMAEYEVLVVDHTNKRAGRIDRLLVGVDRWVVEDFKCNAVITPDKLKVYWEQLKFYSELLEANAIKTGPPQIHHYNGKWKTYKEGVSA